MRVAGFEVVKQGGEVGGGAFDGLCLIQQGFVVGVGFIEQGFNDLEADGGLVFHVGLFCFKFWRSVIDGRAAAEKVFEEGFYFFVLVAAVDESLAGEGE